MEYWNPASNHISSANIIFIGSRWKKIWEKRYLHVHFKGPSKTFKYFLVERRLAFGYEIKTSALFVHFRKFRSLFASSASGSRNGCAVRDAHSYRPVASSLFLISSSFCTHLIVLCVFLSFHLVNDVLWRELNAFYSVCMLNSSQCCFFLFVSLDFIDVIHFSFYSSWTDARVPPNVQKNLQKNWFI